ncbi:hypothetical protein CGMCC3_g5899 [Colletotrichum fructicola]|nr:uncharacterized protein CGMCC3_g5899 [Colletotrichum fructicola]KAE9577981.1 hypothetical protein CGMCC3_g5899 [Colletotrichum fructicola]
MQSRVASQTGAPSGVVASGNTDAYPVEAAQSGTEFEGIMAQGRGVDRRSLWAGCAPRSPVPAASCKGA